MLCVCSTRTEEERGDLRLNVNKAGPKELLSCKQRGSAAMLNTCVTMAVCIFSAQGFKRVPGFLFVHILQIFILIININSCCV